MTIDSEQVLAIVTSLLAGGGLGQVLTHWSGRRQARRRDTSEMHAQMLDGLTRMAESAQEEADSARRRARLLDDYVLQLREHISAGRPPPPPDWPEDL